MIVTMTPSIGGSEMTIYRGIVLGEARCSIPRRPGQRAVEAVGNLVTGVEGTHYMSMTPTSCTTVSVA